MCGMLSNRVHLADDLGQLVIMVGMPFGIIHQLEAVKMLRAAGSTAQHSKLFENYCMTIQSSC